MLEQIIADILLIIHLCFIGFVVFGGWLLIRWNWMILFHLPAVVWGAMLEFRNWTCPLTPLEQHFRALAGQAGYRGSFIEHYLLPLIYPGGLTRSIQISIGIFVIVVNVAIYGYWLSRLRRHTLKSGRQTNRTRL
jgi:hypothetical protein